MWRHPSTFDSLTLSPPNYSTIQQLGFVNMSRFGVQERSTMALLLSFDGLCPSLERVGLHFNSVDSNFQSSTNQVVRLWQETTPNPIIGSSPKLSLSLVWVQAAERRRKIMALGAAASTMPRAAPEPVQLPTGMLHHILKTYRIQD